MTTVTEIVLDHFQERRQLQRSYLTTSKKWRQLQKSYLTTSKSDDSYRNRTSAYSKSDDSHRDHRQIEAFVRDFLQKRISKVNFWRQSHEASPRQARGKPEASPRQAEPAVSRSLLSTSEQRTFPCKTQHFASRLSTQIILQVAKMTTVTEIVFDHFQKRRQLQRSYLTTSKKWRQLQRSYLTTYKVTTVTEIVLDHFQKWRQLQRSYLTTSKSDDSYRDRTWPLPKVTTVTEIVLDHFQKWRQLQKSYFSVFQKWRQSQRSSPNRSFRARRPSKNESPKSIFDDSHTRQARGKPEASPRQARGRPEPAVSRSLLSTSEQRTFPCKTQHFASRLSTQIILQVAKATTVTEIVLDHFQKWRQLQRSYLTTSKSDDSYRDRTSPLPKVTTVTSRDRTWPLPKVTTVTEIVLDHFQKWRQLQRSYLTTSKSDDSYRDRTWPLPKVTTVTEIALQRTPKVTTVTEIIAKSKLSCETSFKNESPKSIFDDSHTRQARGKPEASPRQAEPAVSRSLLSTSEQRTFPCKTQHFASRLSTQIILQVAKMTTVTEIVLDHFQKRRQLQRSYLTTSKSDDSYRDRTWPLPKVTTVTEIVPHHFQKWRQLQKSYLTTSKSDDSYRNRTWPLPTVTTVREIVPHHFQKWRQLHRSFPKRSFRALALAILCFS